MLWTDLDDRNHAMIDGKPEPGHREALDIARDLLRWFVGGSDHVDFGDPVALVDNSGRIDRVEAGKTLFKFAEVH